MALFYVSTAYIITLGVLRPYKDRNQNRWGLFYHWFVFLILYCLLCVTDLVSDVRARELVGWAMILITCFNLAIGFLRMGITNT